jgi:hypothetical protein
MFVESWLMGVIVLGLMNFDENLIKIFENENNSIR